MSLDHLTTTGYVSARADNQSLQVTNKPMYVGAGLTDVELLNSRPTNFHQEELLELYSKLKSKQEKKEFEDFWKLVQSIKTNPNAHKHDKKKRLITTEPLKLNSFFKEIDFCLPTFLLENGITLNKALLDGAELNRAQLNFAELNDAKLNRAELNDAKLNRAKLNLAELNGAYLNDAKLNSAELNDAKLNRAELNRAKLNDAKLIRAELNGAQLNFAELNGAYLNDAKLNDAELNDADLKGAKLNRAKLNRAEFNGKTVFNNYTKLQNIDVAQGIYINNELELDQNKIKEFFIRRGASANNISFAEAV
jgi:uncharacterized protein YjbI with pentapeptide repeats